MADSKKPLIIITGPTASGKTSLAVELAKKYGGEIISADSRAIYRDIDTASAKPSIQERAGVVHGGFDLVDPGERFTAADFKEYAYKKIDEIHNRGSLPFLVGGTGLYIDAVLYDYQFAGEVENYSRETFQKKDLEELYEYCNKHNIELPENYKNKRYIVRAIEKSVNNYNATDVKSNNYNEYNNIVVGITTPREVLRERIADRNKSFISSGIVEEALHNGAKYGWESEAMTANAYPLIKKFIEGELSEDELIAKMSTIDWRLAKRQITFMKRNKNIRWLDLAEANTYLNNEIKKIA